MSEHGTPGRRWQRAGCDGGRFRPCRYRMSEGRIGVVTACSFGAISGSRLPVRSRLPQFNRREHRRSLLRLRFGGLESSVQVEEGLGEQAEVCAVRSLVPHQGDGQAGELTTETAFSG